MTNKIKDLVTKGRFRLRGIHIGNYIPRRCGIATYTKDLTNAINILNPDFLCEIMAIEDKKEQVIYPWEVKFKIQKDNERDYLHAAEYINRSSCDYVNLQHEYGIFGGSHGDYILTLVRNLQKPLITTFHTTLENPNSEQKYILQKIAKYSKACVVMINEAMKRLIKIYDVPEEKIAVIPHGVPNVPFSPADMFKKTVGFNKTDFIIGAINLIAPNKGLEYVIEALPEIIKLQPNTKFVMIGQTHPMVKITQGETYRESLRKLVKKMGLQNNFVEVNEYISLEQLVRYLQSFDIYITPYTDLNATSSGTLAYAVGAGKVCISTPYIYAKETLDNNRGIFIEPKNSISIAQAVKFIIQNPEKRKEIEKNAYDFGRRMIWEHVALDYLNLYSYILFKEKNKE